ncbi:right-handed parallel beta-helix repeat-containing protein [Massilia sp. H-1]|nr:right-handed parallel beta-helix repeat-containing protein [Massilia sp. H-1]
MTLEFDLSEGFIVSAPHWHFENLTIRGVCRVHSWCEHAFHVVGAASDFRSSNNTIVDFNAHFKINGNGGRFPDHGRIEDNTLRNDSVRNTANPVTPIDLVAASHWRIRRNAISDFVKGGGDRISYGGFAKGGGSDNIFEQNLVVCEARLQGLAGQRVGLSLGGGSTGAAYCRDKRCIVEQEKSEIRANLIAACSDDGIYLNSAAASKVTHNTLLDTGGIDLRYPATSVDIEGNLVDGDIRARNGAEVRLSDNRTTPIALLYAGYHPVRSLFRSAAGFDLMWHGEPPRRERGAGFVPDLCGAVRGTTLAYGAFDDIAACLAQKD